jgi:hypothetical protein
MPAEYGGKVGGVQIGHADGPILFRAKQIEPVTQTGQNTFRLLRPCKEVHICAVHLGDDQHRPTSRWRKIRIPQAKGIKQTISFPTIPDLRVGDMPVTLKAAASSDLLVHYQVDYGPIEIEKGRIVMSELPVEARFPIECKIVAYQIGRRIEPAIHPAEPVSRVFQLTGQ